MAFSVQSMDKISGANKYSKYEASFMQPRNNTNWEQVQLIQCTCTCNVPNYSNFIRFMGNRILYVG